MPYSSPAGKQKLFEHIVYNIPTDAKILDVGAGSGGYCNALVENGYYNIDAIEAFKPYIKEFHLKDKYDNVFNINALDFDYSKGNYDLIILGDILEHLSEEDARILLDKMFLNTKTIIISVPYNYEQGIVHGNILEIHLQPNLTEDKFKQLYPEFRCIVDVSGGDYHVGVWVWEKEDEVKQDGKNM